MTKFLKLSIKFIFIFFILLAIFKNLSHIEVKSSQMLIWRRLSTWQTCDKLVTNDKKIGQMAFCRMVWPNNFINLSQILSHGTKLWQTGDKICYTIFWIVLILIVIHRTEYYGKNVNMTYRTSYNITFVYWGKIKVLCKLVRYYSVTYKINVYNRRNLLIVCYWCYL